MKKTSIKSKNNWVLIIALITLSILSYVSFKYFFVQSSNIYIIDQSTVAYGPTTVVGTLEKNEYGIYLLRLSSSDLLVLDVKPGSLEQLIGNMLTIKGELVPPADRSNLLRLKVTNLLSN